MRRTDRDFGNWLAGFIDGEGSFAIDRPPNRAWTCRLTIMLRADDVAILRRVRRTFGFGQMYSFRERLHSRPQAVLAVTSKAGCIALIRVLDSCPLRARKRRDYLIWRQAVIFWAAFGWKHGHGRDRRLQLTYWNRMASFKRRLVAARRYRSVSPTERLS